MRLLGQATDRAHGGEIRGITEARAQDRIRQGAEPSGHTPEASYQLDPERSDHHRLEQSLDRGGPSQPAHEELLRDCLVKSLPIVPEREGTPADDDPGRRRERLERPRSPTDLRRKKLDPVLGSAREEWFVERSPRIGVEGSDRIEPRPKALECAANRSRGQQKIPLGETPRISLSVGPHAASPSQDEQEERGPRELDRLVPFE